MLRDAPEERARTLKSGYSSRKYIVGVGLSLASAIAAIAATGVLLLWPTAGGAAYASKFRG